MKVLCFFNMEVHEQVCARDMWEQVTAELLTGSKLANTFEISIIVSKFNDVLIDR